MADALEHVEAAIVEVTKAREAVARSRQRQVRSADEIARLKAVAFAWLKTHRPVVESVAGPAINLAEVDAAYNTVLDATARDAARTTYTEALKDAKQALVEVRKPLALAIAKAVATSTRAPAGLESPPDFSKLTADAGMQSILSRRWEEVQQCMSAGATLAATVMMGGLMETLLLARINALTNMAPVFTAKSAARDKHGKTLPLADWKLVNMVEVAHELGWVTKSAKDVGNVLREFRNYIHPHKEHTDGVRLSLDDAKMFWDVCKAISRQVLASA